MEFEDPMFAQFPEHNDELTNWFKQKGWPVTFRHYDFDRDVYSWRHRGSKSSSSRTLRVTLTVLEDVPAVTLVQFLESSNVSTWLEKRPDKYVVVCRRPDGNIGVNVLDGPPS